ncbi:MAG: DUF4974 domain-containing protein [Prolixibacteraceae bacterium]|jgi:ferric-dicitrate binding protein FerR (iron transport regulator)|nr:DUF4974 domain-containing protein [Prolixibacteraceae bacterium]
MYSQEQKILLEKFFTSKDQLSPQELHKLFLWLNSEKGNHELEQLLDIYWQQYNEENNGFVDSPKILNEIKKRIQRSKNNYGIRKKIIRYVPYAAAVLVIGIILVGIQYYTINPRVKNDADIYYQYQSSAGIPKDVVLPDGSKITLFPGSSLNVPGNYEKATIRNVKLEGEAFFEIARNEKQPFVLDMGGVGLEVLGTTFNVSNYPDAASIEVVLQSGKVNLFHGNWVSHNEKVLLEPNQLARHVRGEDGFTIEKANAEQYISWIDGVLTFRDNPMEDVFRKLEHWYGVSIEVLDPSINKFIYTATIKHENLEQILKLIEYTSPVKCELVRGKDQSITKVFIQKQ